jgi:ferredoxin
LRIEGRFPAPGDYRIHLCDQCGACAEVCPVEAIGEDENGVYRIDEDLCTSCMLCVDACPYEVIVENNRTSMPIKCTNCGACVDVCPRDAIETV